jgi:hypothetical protein
VKRAGVLAVPSTSFDMCIASFLNLASILVALCRGDKLVEDLSEEYIEATGGDVRCSCIRQEIILAV